jgi:hypothetical protein
MNFINCKMKYILNQDSGQFFLIPMHMNHSDAIGIRPTHAGFVKFNLKQDACGNNYIQALCFGESVSLKLKSDPDTDADIISRGILESPLA